MDDFSTLHDHKGRELRLTAERRKHILEHPEMDGEFWRIEETLGAPDLVVETTADPAVHVYHRHYSSTPVTSKYLYVVVKSGVEDTFVLTAFFSSRVKKGSVIWQK